MWNEKLVKEVREGRLVILFDSEDKQELRDLIRYCFPKCYKVPFAFKDYCYGINLRNIKEWDSCSTNQKPHKSIKEFYMKEQTKYTKEDWINGKVALEWENDKAEKINKFFKECDNTNIIVLGKYKYYYCNSSWKGHYTCENTTNLPIVKIDDIMEEEFVLPQEWLVKVTKENQKELTKFKKSFSNSREDAELGMYVTEKGFNVDIKYHPKDFYTEITYEQFLKYVVKMEEKEQFPKDDFGVIVENNNGKEIVNYLISKGFNNQKGLDGTAQNVYYGILKDKTYISYFKISESPFSQKFTLEQLKQLDSNMETKKILGYKLIKLEYIDCVKEILKEYKGHYSFDKNTILYPCSMYFTKIKEAGVLDIWFTPVYEPEKPKEIIVNMGSFELVVTPKGIFHKGSENITQFVKELVEFYQKLPLKFDKYDCTVSNVQFIKVGCQTGTTLLNWKKVWEEYQLIKG